MAFAEVGLDTPVRPNTSDLPSLARVRLVWEATTPVRFAQRPSDTLWSALGAALHDTAPDLYAGLVKPGLGTGGGEPSPLIVAADPAQRGVLLPGETVSGELVFVGSAAAQAGRVLEAAGRVTALGSDRERGFGLVRLAHVQPLDPAPPPTLGTRAVLAFTSPVALRQAGRTLPPTPSLLIRRLAWRARELARLTTDAPVPDFRPLVALGDALEGAFDGREVRGHRYSARQRAEVPTGGFVGTLALEGAALPALAALLAWGAHVGAGKNAERGYGRYTITAS